MTDNQAPQSPKPLSAFKQGLVTFVAVLLALPVANFISFFIITIFFLIIVAIGSSGSSSSSLQTEHVYGDTYSRNKIVVLPITGPILSTTAAEQDPLNTLFGNSYTDGDKLKATLQEISNDKSIKAVLLQIDSPGGMINASNDISEGVSYFREKTAKPVYAYISSLGASGAYWTAASTDKIYADAGSESGNIGVILGSIPFYNQPVQIGDVATREPIEVSTFSAGKYKDLGNPYRRITPEERQILQTGLEDEYTVFVNYVAKRRNIDPLKIRNEIGAGIYGNTQALVYHLIDSVGSEELVYQDLARAAGLSKNNYTVERQVKDTGFLGSLFGVQLQHLLAPQAKNQASQSLCSMLMGKPLYFQGDSLQFCK